MPLSSSRIESANSSDTTRNLINMKTVIITLTCTIVLGISLVLLHNLNQSHIPYNLILTVAFFTIYLVTFAQNPKIVEFFQRKLVQKQDEVKENFGALRCSILRGKENQVGVQNVV